MSPDHNPDAPPILRPLPRRPFELNLRSTSSSSGSSPAAPSHPPTPPRLSSDLGQSLSAQLESRLSQPQKPLRRSSSRLNNTLDATCSDDADSPSADVPRSRSTQNLTSSTLFGIYQPTMAYFNGSSSSDINRDSSGPATPWGTGAETPSSTFYTDAYSSNPHYCSRALDMDKLRASAEAAGLGSGYAGPGGVDATESGATSSRGAIVGGAGAAAAAASLGGAVAPPADDARRNSTTSRPSRDHQRRASQDYLHLHQKRALPLFLRGAALFVIGVAYGVIISHLHENIHISTHNARVAEGIDRRNWPYLLLWGCAGVALGSALPWVDWVWDGDRRLPAGRRKSEAFGRDAAGSDWIEAVRSIGAFVGIAFAIRKLPWQSTLQVSLTLALVNPALWYLLDRSKPGFTLSSAVGLAGTFVLLLLGEAAPVVIPAPPIVGANVSASSNNAPSTTGPAALRWRRSMGMGNGGAGKEALLFAAGPSYEQLGTATWFWSVLFCSCVCFGNIGRRLFVSTSTASPSTAVVSGKE
ncbi:insulin-induced protein-domain-containing protein [Phyllosticta citrichinensis]|uniref:Insulin-induced protein-domain-containing protein n=1 Tax=Phyllosticta citrichinensis TaxID=1130410 RepID=A0ABR1Y6I3_9PEZI